MADDDRRCPGCGAPCRREHLACRSCWARVPAEQKRAVTRAFGEWRDAARARPFDRAAYAGACQALTAAQEAAIATLEKADA
jgi:hypothetical protein